MQLLFKLKLILQQHVLLQAGHLRPSVALSLVFSEVQPIFFRFILIIAFQFLQAAT